MKTWSMVLVAIMMTLMLCISAFAGTYSAQTYSSAEQTADAAVLTTQSAWRGIIIFPDGSNKCTVELYDHASSATGTSFWKHIADSGSTEPKGIVLSFPWYVTNGVYADMTCSGTCSYRILYNTFAP